MIRKWVPRDRHIATIVFEIILQQWKFIKWSCLADIRFRHHFIPLYTWDAEDGLYNQDWRLNMETVAGLVLPGQSKVECCIKCRAIANCNGVQYISRKLSCHMYGKQNVNLPWFYTLRSENYVSSSLLVLLWQNTSRFHPCSLAYFTQWIQQSNPGISKNLKLTEQNKYDLM